MIKRKYSKGQTSLLVVVKGFIRLGYTTEFARTRGKERGYVCFQKYIPNIQICFEYLEYYSKYHSKYHFSNFLDQAQNTDINRYLPDNCLTKVDRSALAHGLEERPPFLDHEFVELINSLPISMKYNLFNTKIVLRNLLKEKFNYDTKKIKIGKFTE